MSFFEYATVTFFAITGGFGAAFSFVKIFDDVFGNGSAAKELATRFKAFNLSPTFSRAYVNATFLSDLLYGERLISLRAFFVSFAITAIWLIVLFFVCLGIYGKRSWFFNDVFTSVVVHQFSIFVVFCIAIDFISVCMTRRILLFAIDKSAWVKLACLVLDLVASALLFFALFSFVKMVAFGYHTAQPSFQIFTDWFETTFQLNLQFQLLHDAYLVPQGNGDFEILNGESEVIYAFPEGMFFAASLLTSFWIATHVMAYCALGTAMKVTSWTKRLIAQSSIDSKPFLTISLIVTIFGLFPIWLGTLFSWWLRHR